MEPELKALIESPEFGLYHKKFQSRTFSPFDVLRVADVEIRHSNVLAWLLTPNETHGIGGRFLRELVCHLAGRPDAASLRPLKPLPRGFDDEDNVEITREDYHQKLYADITVRFKAQRVLLIIENKLGASYPDAEAQIELYQKAFGKKYTGYAHIPGVLLTASTSPEGRDAERGFMHLGWKDVAGIIRSLLEDQKNFAGDHVRAFVKQYVEVIEERLVHVGDDLAERLRKAHPQSLKKLQEEPALLDEVHEPQRSTVQRWVVYFEERPTKLKEEVAEYLTRNRRVGAGIRRAAGRGAYKSSGWLHWYDMPHGRDLNVDDCVWWAFTFTPRNVTLELGRWSSPAEQKSNMDRIWRFLQETPIDPGRPKRYPPMKMGRYGGVIYRHPLLNDDELSGPFESTVKLLHARLDEFFGSDGDYERIERYFRCLAFDRRGPREPSDSGGADSPAPAAS